MQVDFWASSGWHLLQRRDDGRHAVSDDFLRAYLLRPELTPVEESCPAERRLHAALLESPRQPITPVTLLRLKDPDARENYEVFAAFRDLLTGTATLEDAYLALATGAAPGVPSLFLDHLTHAILRGILDGCVDGVRLRAAECLFRTQSVMVSDGAILLADTDTVALHARSGGLGSLGALVLEAQTPLRQVELDVVGSDNAELYLQRSDRFDMVLDVSFTRPGLDALCRVLEAWVRHFLAVDVGIQPLQAVRDAQWRWHLGLDAEATVLLNDLYAGTEVDDDRLARLLSLFRIDIKVPELVRVDVRGRPVYMGMAQDAARTLRLKPQNLLVNLPLAYAA
ncbi:MAG: DUF6352 family protein [Geminicoccaceae bacterium]